MLDEHWEGYSEHSSYTEEATPHVSDPRNAMPKKRHSVVQKTLRSRASSSTGRKNRGNGRRNMMNEHERRLLLESDVWAGEVTEISVECKGCEKTISLDKRFTYYPGLWIKHRYNCSAIRRLDVAEAEKKSEGERATNPRGGPRTRGKSKKSTSSAVSLSARDLMPTSAEGKEEDQPHVSQHLRYDPGPSWQLLPTSSLANTEGYDNTTENMEATAQPYWRIMSDGLFENSYQQPSAITERTRFDEISNFYERAHWTTAPFAPADQDVESPHVSGLGRRLYRYSTRWELATNFREANLSFLYRDSIDPVSKDEFTTT